MWNCYIKKRTFNFNAYKFECVQNYKTIHLIICIHNKSREIIILNPIVIHLFILQPKSIFSYQKFILLVLARPKSEKENMPKIESIYNSKITYLCQSTRQLSKQLICIPIRNINQFRLIQMINIPKTLDPYILSALGTCADFRQKHTHTCFRFHLSFTWVIN